MAGGLARIAGMLMKKQPPACRNPGRAMRCPDSCYTGGVQPKVA
jgi:hypothetical protein